MTTLVFQAYEELSAWHHNANCENHMELKLSKNKGPHMCRDRSLREQSVLMANSLLSSTRMTSNI